ncbi:hypothetical protein H0H93_010444 [Arthromyces matolae]|nr:hypothetical protein H0H93_010444 [Arthromyces matolae]
MMTESSHEVFSLAYFLHPLFRANGAIQLNMPPYNSHEPLNKDQYPPVYRRLLMSALKILQGEQQQAQNGGREESTSLVNQIYLWAYNAEPFCSHLWDMTTSPLDYWKAFERDSNSSQLARIAIKVFSISPLEICDERTASRLGWFNAARRSSMSPENLIECTKLYDLYTNGFEEGQSEHKARVYVPKIKVTSDTSPSSQTYSSPSLADLLNEDNLSPLDVNVERLEAEWFEASDPYDLAETDRMDAANSDGIQIQRCSTRWNVGDLVKLDSPLLGALISRLGGDETVEIIGGKVGMQPHLGSATPCGTPGDWNIDDLV